MNMVLADNSMKAFVSCFDEPAQMIVGAKAEVIKAMRQIPEVCQCMICSFPF
jgi:hypothetical protein